MKFYADYVWYGGKDYRKTYCVEIGSNDFILFEKKLAA